MKYIVAKVDSCERCPFLDGPECAKAERIIRVEDTAPIPDWCPLPDAPRAKLCESSGAPDRT